MPGRWAQNSGSSLTSPAAVYRWTFCKSAGARVAARNGPGSGSSAGMPSSATSSFSATDATQACIFTHCKRHTPHSNSRMHCKVNGTGPHNVSPHASLTPRSSQAFTQCLPFPLQSPEKGHAAFHACARQHAACLPQAPGRAWSRRPKPRTVSVAATSSARSPAGCTSTPCVLSGR